MIIHDCTDEPGRTHHLPCPICGQELALYQLGCAGCSEYAAADYAAHLLTLHADEMAGWAREFRASREPEVT